MDSEACSHIARWFLVIVCYHACTIRADDGDEFSNNLFSDLAPLLALFGEQVAKQYLSQSLSWLDCVIFAMAPLGIITAIISAIRVAGPIWLRAVIGRARESKGDAELELMSSTSIDVCELWNGRSVVRAIGESDITEVFWLEEVDSKPTNPGVALEQERTPTAANAKRLRSLPTEWYQRLLAKLFPTPESQQGPKLDKSIGTIFSAREAQRHRLLYKLRHPDAKLETNQTNGDTESKNSSDSSEEKPNPPNISLNILGDPTSKFELVLVAFTTTILQLGVVAFQITITYFSPFKTGFTKGGSPPASYACPLTVAGTLLVMIGMFICAMVVQLKSREDKWYFCDNIVIDSQRYKLKLGWLQRHQRVMDQTFDGYCLWPPETRRKVLYSHFDHKFESRHFWTVIGTLEVAQYLHRADITLDDKAKTELSFEFILPISYSAIGAESGDLKSGAIRIEMKRNTPDTGSTWADWKIDRRALQAVFALWASNKEESEESGSPNNSTQGGSPRPPDDHDGNLIFIGPSSEFNILDYEMFIGSEPPYLTLGRSLERLKSELRVSPNRVFGFVGTSETEEHVAFKTSANIFSLRTRHILTCFFNQLFRKVKDLRGQTKWSRGAGQTNISGIPIIQMGNSHLDNIIDILHNSGIDGTRQELLTILVPALQRNGNLLRIFDAFSQVIQDAKNAESANIQPQVSMEEVSRIFIHAVRMFRKSNHWLYVGDILFGLLQVCGTTFGNKHKWTKSAYSLVSQVCYSIEAEIYNEIENRGGGHGGQFWSDACLSLVQHCGETLGDESPEYKMLQRLFVQAESLKAIHHQPPLPMGLVSPRASIPTIKSRSETTAELPLNEKPASSKNSTTTTTTSFPTDPIISSQLKEYPEIIRKLVQAEHPKTLFKDIIQTNQEKDKITLISQALDAAAYWNSPRVVALCFTEIFGTLSKSISSIEDLKPIIIKTATTATLRNNGTIIDLLFSKLDEEKIKLLNEGTDSSKPNCLQIACENGSTDVVHFLLSGGLDPELSSDGDFQSRPLYLAARGGFTDILSLLFFYGVSPACKGSEAGHTFLHHAAKHGAKKTIDFVVSLKLNLLWLLFARDDDGHFPLEIAIIEGHEPFAIHIFEAMLKHRQWYSWEPELDTERSHGQSLLHLACMHDLPELAKILINHGFQPRVVDEHNYSAFQIAAVYGSCKVGRVLLEHDKRQAISQDADVSSMLLAASSDQADYVELLLENGAKIEACDPTTGYTALLAAAIEGKVKTVKLLLKKGANILARDRRERTFGQLVMISGVSECLNIIFNNKDYPGAKNLLSPILLLTAITSKNSFDNIWWILEQLSKDEKTLSSLLQVGENVRNSFRILTHSFLVSRMHDTEKTLTNFYFKPYIDEENKLLPKAPVDVTWGFSKRSVEELDYHFDRLLWLLDDPRDAAVVSDSHGNTALVYAAGTGSKLACKKILQYMREHMEPDLLKVQLKRAFHMALYGGRAGIVKILIDAGVDPNKPLQIANFHLTPLSLLLRIAAVTRKNRRWEVPFNDDSNIGPWENDFDLLECLDLFLKPGMNTTPTLKELEKEESLLHLAIMCNSPEVLEKLVAAGVDIKLSLQAQRPLLHFALSFEAADPNWILVLCKHGIDINAVDKQRKNALIIEVGKLKASTTVVLIDNGAKWGQGEKFKAPEPIEVIKLGGSSLLSLLCKRHKRSKPEEYQNYIDTPGAYGSCPVHIAAKHHSDSILEFLWLAGADMHAKDKQGRNALSYALESKSTMRLLVKLCRINPNERLTEKEYTAAHIAVRTIQDPTQIAKTLQDLWNLGADFNIKDKVGKIPADYVGFASRRPKFPIRSVVLPNKPSKVEWEENAELCRQLEVGI
ncbi:hypothetical protein TWF173_006152 [Orbilia oligospora]|nr:hypothetical protein TWF173_006152 [Orbilia oligospora]